MPVPSLLLLSLCTIANRNEAGAKSGLGLHLKGKHCSTVSKNGRNKAGFFHGGLEEIGLRKRALIKYFPKLGIF